MSTQLDILALEPFYDGTRRQFLQTLIHCSRHRWTLLKLPPRRIEHRLSAASAWFAEQLIQRPPGPVDIVFAGEAMNLADFFRLVPALAKRPSVVYFHSNQLPEPTRRSDSRVDLANLDSAMVASELWFNSMFHLRTFFAKASALVMRRADLMMHNPMQGLMRKAQLFHPPVDWAGTDSHKVDGESVRRRRSVLVDTRGGDVQLLNIALGALGQHKRRIELFVIGPTKELDSSVTCRAVSQADDEAIGDAIQAAGLYLSIKPHATFDRCAIEMLTTGGLVIVPDTGIYPELIPESLRRQFFYDGTHDQLASRLGEYLAGGVPLGFYEQLKAHLRPYAAINASRAIDGRLEELVVTHSVLGDPLG